MPTSIITGFGLSRSTLNFIWLEERRCWSIKTHEFLLIEWVERAFKSDEVLREP